MDFNKNYYDILEINKEASPEEIKSNYRKLAKEHHPDVTQNHDDSKFKELSQAYEVLSDSSEKEKYDVHSPHGKNYQPGFGNSFFRMNINGQDFNPFGPFGFGGFDDSFFRDIFHRKEEFFENLDITVNLNVNLKDVYNNNNIL